MGFFGGILLQSTPALTTNLMRTAIVILGMMAKKKKSDHDSVFYCDLNFLSIQQPSALPG